MPEIILTLGPVTFSDFEIPSGIVFGGRQLIAIHQMSDGRRVIDSIGAADTELSFSGAFIGSAATIRARSLNSLRAMGIELSLSWDVFSYAVVISRFDAEYENAAWIPYRLTCTVLRDNATAPVELPPSLSASVLSDLTAAATWCGDMGIDFTGAQAASAASGATTLGSNAYITAQTAIATVQSAIADQQILAEATVQAASFSGEVAPRLLAGNLLSVINSARQLAGLTGGNAYLGRAIRNLRNAST